MKTIYSFVFSLLFLACNSAQKSQNGISGDNSRNALDWTGIYAGKTGADSMETVLQLFDNNTYTLEQHPKEGRTETFNGRFDWNKQGSAVTINGYRYRVGENRLDMLDSKGDITGFSLEKIENPLQEKYWKLVELWGDTVITAEGQREAYIIFRSFDNRFQGNGGCNGFSGGYELRGNGRITFMPAVATQMACVNGMETEAKLHEVLGMADTYIVSGDTLVLTKARMAPMARFEAVYLR